MKKVIISGNKNYGLAKSLYKLFPDATFCSRSNGSYDLSVDSQITTFILESLNYDIFISCSYIPFFAQTILLAKLYKKWMDEKKIGQIIVVGSTADWSTKARFYSTEKKALRDFCRRMAGMSAGGGPDLYPGNNIRITYIAPGMIDLPKQREKHGEDLAKLDPDYIAEVIKWLTEQPANINIHDLSMDPIQHVVSRD